MRTRVGTQLGPPDDGCYEKCSGQECVGAFVVARCQSSEILESAKHAFDDIAPFIGGLVIGMGMFARWVRRNDRFTAARVQPIAQFAGVIGAVCEQTARRGNAVQKLGDPRQIMRLTRCQAERDGPPDLIGQGMNLGRPSAARSSDGVRIVPPFAPLAERCTLTDVLSAPVVPTTPEEPDKT